MAKKEPLEPPVIDPIIEPPVIDPKPIVLIPEIPKTPKKDEPILGLSPDDVEKIVEKHTKPLIDLINGKKTPDPIPPISDKNLIEQLGDLF